MDRSSAAAGCCAGALRNWMHKVVELPSPAYLVVAVGLALIVGGVKTRKAPERRQVVVETAGRVHDCGLK